MGGFKVRGRGARVVPWCRSIPVPITRWIGVSSATVGFGWRWIEQCGK
tara:strand:+ start:231 stop:374 length:144 start_codon:yes stop_codon:yes gene_type:complete